MAKTQQIMDDTADAPRAGEVGALLRVTRERSNQTLRDVADALRIRMAHLEAIEAGEYDRLPGATYAVGFVRAYADHLGLDSNEIVRRFKVESAIVPTRNDLDMPIPVSDGGLPSGAAIVLGLLVIGGIYGAWYMVSNSDRPVAEMVQDVPDRFMALIGGPSDEPAVEPAETAVEAAPGQQVNLDAPAEGAAAPPAEDSAAGPEAAAPAPVAEEPAPAPAPAAREAAPPAEEEAAPPPPAEEETAPPPPTEDVTEAPAAPEVEEVVPPAPDSAAAEAPATETAEVITPPPAPAPAQVEAAAPVAPEPPTPPAAPEPEAAAPAPAPAAPSLASVPTDGRVYGEENADARVILRAREDSWVQVRDNEGLLLTRLLRAGDSYRVPNRQGLRLMTGNAGGLLIELDGALLPPLGGTGEVRRNIALEPAALRAGDATPN